MICECGSTDFEYVFSGQAEFRHIDYVPHIILGRGVGKDIKAIFCKECGLVQNTTSPDGKVFQRKDIVDYFRERYQKQDREEMIEKVVLLAKFNFMHFSNRDKEDVFQEILDLLVIKI